MDERRLRLRFAWAALLLGLPSVAAGGFSAGGLLFLGLGEQSYIPALMGLAGCCGVLGLVILSGRYLHRGYAGLRPGRWPRLDRVLWGLLILGMIAAACVLVPVLIVMISGIAQLDLRPVGAGLLLLLFGPSALLPAFMLLERRRDANAGRVKHDASEPEVTQQDA